MSRLANALLQPGQAYGAGKQVRGLDLQYGGQNGFSPEMAAWVNNQQYVKRPVVATVIEAPVGFQLMKDPQYWHNTLRALVELHPIRISGLNQGLETEFAETPVGGGGQIQEDLTNVRRLRSQPVFSWNEKYGMPVHNFLDGWIRGLGMDPDSKYPNVTALSNRPTDMLSDMSTATMLFYEPDPTHQKVMKAWLITNMFPRSSGDVTGSRDLTAAMETSTYDIEFTGIAQQGDAVMLFAQKLLERQAMLNADPYRRAGYLSDIDAQLTTATKTYENNIRDLGATAVPQ